MESTQGGLSPLPVSEQPAPSSVRLAVVDSDSGFTRVLAKRLADVSWRAQLFPAPPSVEALSGARPHAVVIDFAPLGSEGWAYLERLCARQDGPAVIVCTGPSTVAQRIRGLRIGADDWISKPCHPEEVLARIEAVLRRRRAGSEAASSAPPVVAGELEIRSDMFDGFVGGRAVGLTRKEFELLQMLAGSGGAVITREWIYERVWGYAMVHGDRSVDVFVRKLRRKLESASPGWRYLHTHVGAGYRFEAQPVESEEVSDGSGGPQPSEVDDGKV
jgi:DNA-binding response OmpR family regulator